MRKVFIVGAGNLGIALGKGMSKAGNEVTLLCRNESQAKARKKQYPALSFSWDIETTLSVDSIVIVAVQPADVTGVLGNISAYITDGQIVVSVALGVTIAAMKKTLGDVGCDVYRAMPNTAAAVGQSMTAITTGSNVDTVKDLFESIGSVVCIAEKKFDAFTVLAGSGIAFAMKFVRAYMQAGIQAGFESGAALGIAISVITGACALLNDSGKHPEQYIDSVTTPGGCTIAALVEMEKQGLSAALIAGIMKGIEKTRKQ